MTRPPHALLAAVLLIAAFGLSLLGCLKERVPEADLLIVHGNVYTLSWDEPDREGNPAPNAPHTAAGWRPDAEAVAVRMGKIIFVGTNRDAEPFRGKNTRVIEAHGLTVLPGLIDAHVHIAELGAALERVNLVDVRTVEEAVEHVAARAATTPPGQWIIGQGWDEGAWANHYPDMKLLSERVPDHPVYLKGLHGYAAWGNRLSFEKAGITMSTQAPAGGEIRRGADGKPTGVLTNRAVKLLEAAVPAPTADQLQERVHAGLRAMASAGYVAAHEAGAVGAEMKALETLNVLAKLPLRVYVMLSARDEPLLRFRLARRKLANPDSFLMVRSVKAFYDGALGSRGARLLEDYADRKGYRGVSGSDYGFNQALITEMMNAGFQVAIHAIGDAGNRETLDFFESALMKQSTSKALRPRIEHAQVVDPADVPRFARLGILPSMQPSHAVEDKAWAENRLGPERVKNAYAWRSLRRAGATMVFSSDLPGSDYNIFYGLHSAITRRGKDGQPPSGWYAEQRMSPEEAVRGFTVWGAQSAFVEKETGVLAPGRWGDITVMDIDPFVIGEKEPERLLRGSIRFTVVAGKVVYEKLMP